MGAYLSEVYIRQFCKELAPELLRGAAALGGHEAPACEGFDYCELGAGFGDTVNILAAANPAGRFIGIDLNADHVAFARGFAERGGLANATFLERDLADLDGEALPDFDFVTAHGLFSWVSPETQAQAVAFAARRLRPGGLFYVSYNAMPGWAAIAPLRRWLLEAGGKEGTGVERATRALDAARRLRDAGALYVAQNPGVASMLATMERFGPVYVAHEYFQEHWRPQHFADVAADMTRAGLGFAGQLPLCRNVTRLAVPEAFGPELDAARDVVVAERLKDFATNASFRADVYRKGGGAPDPTIAARYLEATRFGTLVPPERIARDVNLPHGPLALTGEAHLALGRALGEAPASLRELSGRADLAPFGLAGLRGALLDLLAAEQVVAMEGSAAPGAARFNLAALAEPLVEGRPVVLASTAARTGLPIPALHAVMLRLLTGVAAADRPAWIRAFVERQPVKLHVADRQVAGPAEQARVLAEELERFRATRLPKLVALGVVEGSRA